MFPFKIFCGLTISTNSTYRLAISVKGVCFSWVQHLDLTATVNMVACLDALNCVTMYPLLTSMCTVGHNSS